MKRCVTDMFLCIGGLVITLYLLICVHVLYIMYMGVCGYQTALIESVYMAHSDTLYILTRKLMLEDKIVLLPVFGLEYDVISS